MLDVPGMALRGVEGYVRMIVVFLDFFEVKSGNEAIGCALGLCGLRFRRNEATLLLQFGESGKRAVKAAFG